MIVCDKKIAVLLAAYNGAKFIAEQLDSLIAQTSDDWRCYIHDDGSDDGTDKIIAEYAERFPERLTVIEGAPTGRACANFCFMFAKIEAEEYMCCDQDDVWFKDKIARTYHCMRKLETDRSVPCLIYSDQKIADEKLNILAESSDKYQRLHCLDTAMPHLLAHNVVTGCTMMVNRALRDMFIRASDSDKMVMHDWWAALLAAQFGKMYFIKNPTMLYRQHSLNTLGANKMDANMIWNRINRNGRKFVRRSLYASWEQADEFARIYGLDSSSLISVYGTLKDRSKLERLKIYARYGIHKSSWIRTAGMYVLG